MARLTLELPETFVFSCQQVVRVTDLNYANHLGNDAMISLLHEARCQFLAHFGFSESDIDGLGLMVTDLATIYKSECFAGEELTFEVGVMDFNKYGCDVIYRVTKNEGQTNPEQTNQEQTNQGQTSQVQTLVAQAKNGVVFFDYHQRKLAHVPEIFRTAFE
ncbi:thioesterase family protein [Litoribrevibacter albus]|uniref:Thioesterase n=1 Tax=Litoribrevibacter albus TaxID=1473156 RepID=A0AA37SF05_9GAMM|nr:thioesterase family protein [Litoribrevibacter albus]GLQ32779.1 thioesterase [Litoribrevibacter albus]